MGTRIVMCDDHPVFRQGLAAALADEADLELAGQAGTLAGLRQLMSRLRGRVDLVLLDVELPDGPATGLVAELAGQARVVMVSAHDDPHLVGEALRSGAAGYIRKDVEPSEVLRLIRRATEGRTALTGEMALRLAESLRGAEPTPFGRVLAGLSPRQRDIVALVAEGRTNREIAGELHLSEGTVKNHVSGILDHVGVADRTKLAVLYVRHQAVTGGRSPA